MKEFVEEFKNVFKRSNNALAQLILINVVVFVLFGLLSVFSHLALQQASFVSKLESYFAVPSSLSSLLYKPWTIITYAFMHDGFFHILFNMLVLYWFGQLIVNYLGSQKLINLYILGALAGAVSYIAIFNLIPFYQSGVGGLMVGASASVFAIVVGAATLLPNYHFHMLFFGRVRIKYIALAVVLLSFIRITGTNAGGELAHLGGALLGFIYIQQLHKGHDLGRPIAWIGEKIKNIFTRPTIRVTHRSNHYTSFQTKTKVSNNPDYIVNQEEIDEILDKISERGYDALSREEKQKLFNASKK